MAGKTVDFVIEDLHKLGVELSGSAIRGYASKGLIPSPRPGGGRGRRTLFPEDAAVEAAASRYLIENHSMPHAVAARARRIALHLEAEATTPGLKNLQDDRELTRLLGGNVLVALMAGEWLRVKLDAQEQLFGTERGMEERAQQEEGRFRQAKATGRRDEAGEVLNE